MSFPCKSLCRHKLKRPHLTCLFCRIRRLEYGKIEQTHYYYNGSVLVPKDCRVYVLYIDNQRSHANIKAAILKRLLTICEALAN